jgi:hypothetical protein
LTTTTIENTEEFGLSVTKINNNSSDKQNNATNVNNNNNNNNSVVQRRKVWIIMIFITYEEILIKFRWDKLLISEQW